jgi:hypothetical protein
LASAGNPLSEHHKISEAMGKDFILYGTVPIVQAAVLTRIFIHHCDHLFSQFQTTFATLE